MQSVAASFTACRIALPVAPSTPPPAAHPLCSFKASLWSLAAVVTLACVLCSNWVYQAWGFSAVRGRQGRAPKAGASTIRDCGCMPDSEREGGWLQPQPRLVSLSAPCHTLPSSHAGRHPRLLGGLPVRVRCRGVRQLPGHGDRRRAVSGHIGCCCWHGGQGGASPLPSAGAAAASTCRRRRRHLLLLVLPCCMRPALASLSRTQAPAAARGERRRLRHFPQVGGSGRQPGVRAVLQKPA